MTEYDFSPEAYQAHLDNMSRISRWVDRTEERRGEYSNAAALIDPNGPPPAPPSSSPPSELRNSFGGRRKNIPTPLALHPFGTPDPHYPTMQTGVGMSPYASPLHSGVDMGFVYANGLGSPGPMPSPMHGYPGYPMPHSAGVQMMVMAPPLMSPPLVSPPPSPPHYHARHHRHSRRSRANSFSIAPTAPPYASEPLMSMGMAPPTPTYVIMPPTTSRHHRDRHRYRPGVQFVYV